MPGIAHRVVALPEMGGGLRGLAVPSTGRWGRALAEQTELAGIAPTGRRLV